MFVRVLSLVYLFLIRLRFPHNSSISEIIRRRYGILTLSKIRKLEKLDFRIGKARLDITFLETCIDNDVIPNFVKFRTPNRSLRKSKSYELCQRLLLNQELAIKKEKLAKDVEDLKCIKREISEFISSLDFLFISSLFLDGNYKALKQVEQVQNDKLSKILKESPKHEADDLIYNFSSHTLTSAQKSILMKGLNFSLPPKKLKSEDYLLNFELFFREVKNKDGCIPKEFDMFKSDLRNFAYSSIRFYNRRNKKLENITEEEHQALVELSAIDSLIIQKADKGNVIVLIDRNSYISKMEFLLNDTSKFLPLVFDQDFDDLKFKFSILDIAKFLNKLKDDGAISSEQHSRMTPKGSAPGILYGLCKVHKNKQGDCPPFRPILSAIDTPSYNIAKFLVPLLAPIATNRFVCKDSFSFASEVRNENPDLFMASFDVDSLFTNIPLDETIEICISKLYGRKHKYNKIKRSDFRKLLQYAVKDALILFNGKYYIQIDGVAMGSPLGPTLANVFLCHWEEIWLEKCPMQFKPVFYRRYIDDTFLLFTSKDHVKKFHNYVNSKHIKMNFTYELEEENKLSFLDVLIFRNDGIFCTSLYRKPTFSGLYTNYNSYIPEEYKKGLIFCLLFRAFSFSMDWGKFHAEVLFLKDLFRKNLYPEFLIDKCIKIFIHKKFISNVDCTDERQKIVISLPYLGKYSNEVKKKFKSFASKYLKSNFKIDIVWNSTRKVRHFFPFKDRLPKHLCSNVLYRYSCEGCNSFYIGKTARHFLVREYEHLGVSIRTGKNYKYNPKNVNNSAILKHINESETCTGNIDDFTMIGSARCDYHLKIIRSLYSSSSSNPIL